MTALYCASLMGTSSSRMASVVYLSPADKYHRLRHCSEDSEIDIDRTGGCFYTAGPNLLLKERNPCSDRVSMSQTPPKVSRTLRTSHRLNLWRTAGTSRKRPAHDVAIWPIATNPGSAPYTTWAIGPLDVRLIFW